jgi:hypothetical protein
VHSTFFIKRRENYKTQLWEKPQSAETRVSNEEKQHNNRKEEKTTSPPPHKTQLKTPYACREETPWVHARHRSPNKLETTEAERKGLARRRPPEGSDDSAAIVRPPTKEQAKSSPGKPRREVEAATTPPAG